MIVCIVELEKVKLPSSRDVQAWKLIIFRANVEDPSCPQEEHEPAQQELPRSIQGPKEIPAGDTNAPGPLLRIVLAMDQVRISPMSVQIFIFLATGIW